ncbi:hypothetical protein I7I53_02049 [Histoplasma capsulatum var. duboisii H88]|uniref:Uncharacterized protein n=1 Tax=Ajellomyces capsulatus (strain H88) TaxID=544711 RepID=A0A8A1LR69_AJEC8|nr:hypothetical protein I7I53_02049 [Histoplasma capsulatum var. duboisii H88]
MRNSIPSLSSTMVSIPLDINIPMARNRQSRITGLSLMNDWRNPELPSRPQSSPSKNLKSLERRT